MSDMVVSLLPSLNKLLHYSQHIFNVFNLRQTLVESEYLLGELHALPEEVSRLFQGLLP
jgi:hypothetical protein